MNASVVIVGAGPTGLAAANLLGQAGIDTLLLERNPGLSTFPKAISLDDEGLRICQSLGSGERILAHALLNLEVHYLSGGRLLARVAPTGRRNGYPFTSTFYQPEFEQILLRGLQRSPCVQMCFSHTVESCQQTNEQVMLTVRMPDGSSQEITCDYLLACDGGKSTIRRALNISMRGMTFAQPWLVLDSIDDSQTAAIATFFCDPQRPAMTILAPQQRRRWEFMLLPGETEEDVLREEHISALLQQIGCTYAPHLTRKAIYTFHAAIATTFTRGRIFLLGDAAHLMPPFGGQGMNSGLRDAHNLCWKLVLVLQGQASPQLLATYQQERYPHAAAMIRFSSFLGKVIMPTSKPIAMLRDIVLRTLNTIPITRTIFTEASIKPAPRYKRGAILRNHMRKARALTGLLLPQPEVITADGRHILLDDILGPGFAIVCCHPDPIKVFAELNTQFWQELGVRFVCVQPTEKTGKVIALDHSAILPGIPFYVVQTDDTNFLRLCRDVCVVVRPDHYVLGTFKEKDMNRFAVMFQKMLNSDVPSTRKKSSD
jgi:3-(3-hydroxy-phenyl)propionate hydroxylase